MDAGISVKKEAPLNFLTDPQEGRSTVRPADVLVYGWVGGKHACVNLTGVSPLVGLRVEDFTVRRTTLKAASSKMVKYEKACSDNQHVFISFAFDTFGFLTPEAVDLLKRIQKVMHSNVMSPSVFVLRATFYFRITFTLSSPTDKPSSPKKLNVMDDRPEKLKIIPDHFQIPTSSVESTESRKLSTTEEPRVDQSLRPSLQLWTRRKFRTTFMLNLFTLRRLSWGSDSGGQEKVELTAAELESLRSELADLEEKEAYLKAQLQHIDEVLRSARLSGYLQIRTRWAALPGEPPPIDDTEVDDWLPRFVVLHGACIFLYFLSTDISPQDSTLLSDILEVGRLPCFKRENDDIQHAFYILTRHGFRYECSSNSTIQVDSWLTALQSYSKLESDKSAPNGSIEM
ncbi:Pleckstrin proteiny (PH) domain-containing protein [Trifolium repens]|nr:Pleckstrin proteiny (PH) domain-containing protein [Trifolium repens]